MPHIVNIASSIAYMWPVCFIFAEIIVEELLGGRIKTMRFLTHLKKSSLQ